MIILGQGDNISFSCDLESTTMTDVHVGTSKLTNDRAILLENSYMEAVAVTVTNKHISKSADVNAIGINSNVLTSNASYKFTLFGEYYNTMAL